jgi:hypothetical protein
MAGFGEEPRWCLDFTLSPSIPRQIMAASCMAPQKFKLCIIDPVHKTGIIRVTGGFHTSWFESLRVEPGKLLYSCRGISLCIPVLYFITWPTAVAMSPSPSTCGHVLLWLFQCLDICLPHIIHILVSRIPPWHIVQLLAATNSSVMSDVKHLP